MEYEFLLSECDFEGLIAKEKPLKYNDGRIKGNRIAIRRSIETTKEKACVLAEELGHYYTTVGDILDQNDVSNRKQEYRARLWGYDKMIGLQGLIAAHEAHCENSFETAEYLGVTEQYLKEVIECYRSKYGTRTCYGDYIISFEPHIGVSKKNLFP